MRDVSSFETERYPLIPMLEAALWETEWGRAHSCPGPTRVTVSRFPRYQQAIQSLPLEEREKIWHVAQMIIGSFRPGCQPVGTVRLVGHADRDVQRGPAFERKISGDRAQRVQEALMSAVRNPAITARINWQTAAAGASQLVVPVPRTEQQRALNRRVEIALVPAGLPVPDVADTRINVFAQQALLRMLRSDLGARADATGMVAAVKAGQLAGIYKEDDRISRLFAQKMKLDWRRVIPSGEDSALVLDATNLSAPPVIDFRDSVRSLPKWLDPALRKAWNTFLQWRTGQLIRCPLPRPGPIVAEAFGSLPVSNLAPGGIFCQLVAPAPDSPVANRFIPAHSSRWCTPGSPGGTCASITPPRMIDHIVIHALATPPGRGISAAESVIRSWQQRAPRGLEVSAHYIVDRDGTITQMVREDDVAFHAGAANPTTIGIEHADLCNQPEPYTPQLYERSVELVRDIATRHNIQLNRNTVVGHSQVRGGGGHEDPGIFWDWEYYFALLLWNGNPATRPDRWFISTAHLGQPPVGSGWQQRFVQRGPADHCATPSQPYGSCGSTQGCFWQSQFSASGIPAEFIFRISDPGEYKVSLWWPRVVGASGAVQVVLETPLFVATPTMNQSAGAGQWNDVGPNFQASVRNIVRVRINNTFPSRGIILADAVRLLKIR